MPDNNPGRLTRKVPVMMICLHVIVFQETVLKYSLTMQDFSTQKIRILYFVVSYIVAIVTEKAITCSLSSHSD